MAAILPGTGVPEDAPGWAIRLEAKLDIAIAQHGQAIDSLTRDVDNIRRDRERSDSIRDAADKDLDTRVDVLERSPFVTTKGLWLSISGAIGALAGVAAFINSVSNIF